MLKFKQILFITLSLGSGILYAGGNVDWKLYGNGYENQRHSSLKQINHSYSLLTLTRCALIKMTSSYSKI